MENYISPEFIPRIRVIFAGVEEARQKAIMKMVCPDNPQSLSLDELVGGWVGNKIQRMPTGGEIESAMERYDIKVIDAIREINDLIHPNRA